MWGRDAPCPGVDPLSGFLHVAGSTFGFPAASPAPSYSSSYNADAPAPGAGGNGWTLPQKSLGFQPDGTVMRTDAAGTQHIFAPLAPLNQPVNGNGPQFAKPVHVYYNLAYNPANNTFAERDTDGTITDYAAFGSTTNFLPTLVTDRNGDTLTYSRDGSGNILSITDIHGRSVQFHYAVSGSTTYLQSVTGTDANGATIGSLQIGIIDTCITKVLYAT